jgi:hypothetical protein
MKKPVTVFVAALALAAITAMSLSLSPNDGRLSPVVETDISVLLDNVHRTAPCLRLTTEWTGPETLWKSLDGFFLAPCSPCVCVCLLIEHG